MVVQATAAKLVDTDVAKHLPLDPQFPAVLGLMSPREFDISSSP